MYHIFSDTQEVVGVFIVRGHTFTDDFLRLFLQGKNFCFRNAHD